MLAFKKAFVNIAAGFDEPFVNGGGQTEEADSARLSVHSALEIRGAGVQERQRYFFLTRIGVIEGGGIHERGDAPRPRLIRVGAVFEQGVHQRQSFFCGGIHIEA